MSTAAAHDESQVTASFARRILALLVDWVACTLVTIFILGPAGWSESSTSGFYTIGIFVLQSAALIALSGGSFGQLATRLRVQRWPGGGNIDLLSAVLRQVMIALLIPPLVFRPDGRGLHDMVAGSAVVPLRVS